MRDSSFRRSYSGRGNGQGHALGHLPQTCGANYQGLGQRAMPGAAGDDHQRRRYAFTDGTDYAWLRPPGKGGFT